MDEAVRLEDRQRVHIGTEPDRARRVAGPEHADDAGLADAVMHLDAEGSELLGDNRRCALLLETQLRMRMDIAPPRRQLIVELAHSRNYMHVSPPPNHSTQPVIARAARQSFKRRPARGTRARGLNGPCDRPFVNGALLFPR